MEQMQETSQLIIDAARKRFMHYGYQKTTMAEIARDLNMSTGNLYRYFPSKVDIAEHIALNHERDEYHKVANIIDQNISAKQKFEKIFFLRLKEAFDINNPTDRSRDFILALSKEKPLFVKERRKRKLEYLLKIYDEGIKNGEFSEPHNREKTMQAMLHATLYFTNPDLEVEKDMEELALELDEVLHLIFRGLE